MAAGLNLGTFTFCGLYCGVGNAALPDLSPVSRWSPINDDAAPAPPSGSLAPGAAVAQWVALWQIVFFIQRVLSHYRAIGYTPYFFSGGHPTELSGIGAPVTDSPVTGASPP